MPTFKFTSPEGKNYAVDAPEGATNEQAFAMLQKSLGGAADMSYGDLPTPSAPPVPKQDENVDYDADIDNMRWRAGFSFMKGERQRKVYLDKTLGEGNWGFDSSGNTIVAPAGLKRIGIESTKARPIDKPAGSKADIADLAAHVPPVAGGIGGSLAATGVGALPGMAIAGAGAGLGQAMSEAAKAAAGYPPTIGEAAEAIGEEAFGSGVGEGAFRLMRGTGRVLTKPGASAMTPNRLRLMNEALKRGYIPAPGQITGIPIQQRFEGISRRMFGDAQEHINSQNALRDVIGLRRMAGKKAPGQEAIGEEVAGDFVTRRQAFGEAARARYREIDALVGDQPIVPSRQLKSTVDAIIKDRPKTADGRFVTIDAPTQSFLERILALPDSMTTVQMQELRSTLRNKGQIKDLAPNLSTREYILLKNAADRTFDEAGTIGLPASMRQSKILGPQGQPVNVQIPARPPSAGTAEAIKRLRETDKFYKEGIKQFDLPAIGRVTKDQSLPGSIEPDQIFEYIIKEKHPVRAHRAMNLLSEPVKQHVRRSLADDLTANAIKDADDPFSKIITGGDFKAALDGYGKDTLDTVMGKDWTREAYKAAAVMKLITSGNKQSGGLVVAATMLNPLENVGKIAAYRALSGAFMHKKFLKLMTVGMSSPTSKAGKAALSSVENALRIYTQSGPAAFEEAMDAMSSE